MTEPLKEWTEADGTVYRLREDGKTYDVIPPAKKSKAKKSEKSANNKKGN